MPLCPVCYSSLDDLNVLSSHLYSLCGSGDNDHLSWINSNVGPFNASENDFQKNINLFYEAPVGLENWIITKFIMKFYGKRPHPFIVEMQNPSIYTFMGYVTEHYHFLKQWVRSCLAIGSNTDVVEVQRYEVENVIEEYLGNGSKPHIDLLIDMGLSLGMSREQIVKSVPLDQTKSAIKFWEWVCRNRTWQEGMAAMHSLELIANREIMKFGGTCNYFIPEIVKNKFPPQVWMFLGAGYDADLHHSIDALDIVTRNSRDKGVMEDVQSAFLASIENFDRYLNARLERGKMYEKKL